MPSIRSLLAAAGIAAAGIAAAASAGAQSFPDKPIRYVLHVSPGGATDVMARKLAIGLEKVLGQSVVVENRPGGRGATQMAELTGAKPDGYTIGSVTNSHIGAFNQTLRQYDVNSVDWLARLVTEPFLIAVHADSPVKSLQDLVQAVKAKPGGTVVAGFVRGSGGHFAWEMFAKAAGLTSRDVRWVPFDSVGDAVTAVLGKHADAAVAYVDLVKDHVQAGSMRVIGVMAPARLEEMPQVATFNEQGFDVDPSWQQFRGVIAPKGLPAEIKARLARAIDEVLQSDDMKKYIQDSALVNSFAGPEDFTLYALQHDKLTKDWMQALGLKR